MTANPSMLTLLSGIAPEYRSLADARDAERNPPPTAPAAPPPPPAVEPNENELAAKAKLEKEANFDRRLDAVVLVRERF